MANTSKRIRVGLVIMALLAILTGLYPAIFAFMPSSRGLFSSKPEVLLQSSWYIPLFMVHIGFGAVAILSGSTQFFEKLRLKRLSLHRMLGKIYVASVIPSGLAGLVVGFYATGAWYSKAGFVGLALGWLLTTTVAYITIRKGNIKLHRVWMMRSYAFCFAFVTFRIYLGLATAMNLPFSDFYSYLSFLCWVPNIIFIEWRIKQLQ
ncbi:DUF2306 domain-containing protein [Winogradskyella jejuensis]|uniref:Predicted membrane protein n=1 Tax=Winogradskyella jejuensis TaxID=1089305 RepID=A0A1M5VRA7_9FLAO|nr:DUF2306 domain-containing protein [Winogradskyella jejuensis]SHH77785.1 Predicted membrane protein [Winogradskyella jejuensis]